MFNNKKFLSKSEFIAKMTAITYDLAPEEADVFLTYLIDQSVLKNNARIVRMAKNEKNIAAIGYGSGRFLKPAATFSKASHAKKTFASNKITLKAEKVRGVVTIYDDDLEDVPDGPTFKSALMKLIAAKVANELDEAGYIADANDLAGFGDDDIRSMWDGWRYQITHSADGQDYYNEASGGGVIVDAEGAEIAAREEAEPFDWNFLYASALKGMPSIYKTVGLQNLRFFNSDQVTLDYTNALAKRNTSLGDQAITGQAPLGYGTVPIVSCPLMPTTVDESGILDGSSEGYSDILLTPNQNLIIGLQRELKIETDRDAENEATDVYYSMRVDFKIENINACVLVKNVAIA